MDPCTKGWRFHSDGTRSTKNSAGEKKVNEKPVMVSHAMDFRANLGRKSQLCGSHLYRTDDGEAVDVDSDGEDLSVASEDGMVVVAIARKWFPRESARAVLTEIFTID